MICFFSGVSLLASLLVQGRFFVGCGLEDVMNRRAFLQVICGGAVVAAVGCESAPGSTVLDFMRAKGISYRSGVRERNGKSESFIEEVGLNPDQPQEGRFWLFSVVDHNGQPREIDLPPDQYMLRPGDHATWELSNKYKDWKPA